MGRPRDLFARRADRRSDRTGFRARIIARRRSGAMSTPLPPPPATAPSGRSGGPARRAIRRWAWRLLRREWRQQVLVLSLLVVAVAATTVGLGLVVNVQQTHQGIFRAAHT